MYELYQLGECSWYIDCPAKIGIYQQTENEVYLIDSGSDKDAAKKVKKVLEEKGWKLKGIINTHSNADHIGGNQYLQKQYGCKIFAPGIEAAFTNYPLLEPSFLFGGFPPKALRHKFLMAAESECADISDPDFPAELKAVPLPGHFFQMMGILTPDGTFFAADCVSSAATLEKYKVSFLYDVSEYLKTLDAVEKLDAKRFVPAHAEVCESMAELVDINRSCIREVAEKLLEICEEKLTSEEILKRIFDTYSLTMNFQQYVLVGSTVRSYLAWLLNDGKLEAVFEDNRLLWHRV